MSGIADGWQYAVAEEGRAHSSLARQAERPGGACSGGGQELLPLKGVFLWWAFRVFSSVF